jgi:ubiquinone/menaquinone biosynthesis C-methylase UbiE
MKKTNTIRMKAWDCLLHQLVGIFRKTRWRVYKMNRNKFGLLEAFFFPTTIDGWMRYADVIDQIKKTKRRDLLILDVGAGGSGIARFLDPLTNSIFLVDIKRHLLTEARNKNCLLVVADGAHLPFKDRPFNIVVSVATIEHITRSRRPMFLNELKRVCKEELILYFPAQSDDGEFKGREWDFRFQAAHKRVFGFEESNTTEHIVSSHPTTEEVRNTFPNIHIYGRKNCEVWFKYMMFSRKPFIGIFAGLVYYLFWNGNDYKPPFYECLAILESDEPINLKRCA